MLGMTLINLPLSEFVVVSGIVDNMSHAVAAVVCSNDIAVICCIVVFQLYSGISAGKCVETRPFKAC